MGRRLELSQEQIDTIIYNYVILKKGLIPSGKAAGVSQKVVERVLKENGIKKRTYVEAKDILRVYSVDDDYFKKQSHNMGYILGFLAADGNISKKENKITLLLDSQDEEILEKIRKEVKSTREIRRYKRKNGKISSSLIVYSSAWKKDLACFSIIPEKTFKLEPPEHLSKEYWLDYIRGFFDGDGSVSKSNGTIQFKIGSASKPILDWIREYLATEYGICNKGLSYQKLESGNDFWNLLYYGENVRKLYKLLYQNTDSLKLDRKYNKFTTLYEEKYPRDYIPNQFGKKDMLNLQK